MMKKKTLHLDIKHTLTQSLGRFLSIMCLMGLGAFGLVGLKVTGPDINRTVQQTLNEHHAADLIIMADYGLSQDDVNELHTIENSHLELGYFTDTVIGNTPQSIRVLSQTQRISTYQVVLGNLPQTDTEIALSSTLQNNYNIGDTLTLSEEGKLPLLSNNTFTISGFVTSNEFLSTNVLGISTSGSGTLSGFAVVKPELFNSNIHTIARLRFHDLAPYNTFSKDYENKVTEYEKIISEKLKDNGAQRLYTIQQGVNIEISDGTAKIKSALDELDASKKKLDDSQFEIDSKKETIAIGWTAFKNNEDNLKQSKETLDEVKHQLEASKTDLDQGKIAIDEGFKQIQEQKDSLNQAKVQLDAALSTLNDGKIQLDIAKNQLQQVEQQMAQAEEWLQLHFDKKTIITSLISFLKEAISIGKQELLAKEKEYENGKQQYETNKAKYDKGILELNSGQTLLENKLAEYNKGLQQYEAGLVNYQDGFKKYEDGIKQLENARKHLINGQNQLADVQNTLNIHYETFENEKSKATSEITIAQKNITNAKADLQELIEPTYHVYTRASALGGEGYATIYATSQGISSVGNMFPLVLYGVAALVTVTTMTRFVNEERTKAGILKALGYTNMDIYKKFMFYGLISSISGTILGILAGMYFLPYMLGETLLATTILPKIHLLFYWDITLIALMCSIFCSVVPALWIAKRELKASASQLLLPRPPANAATILLERIPFIWQKLTFTQKVTARNIFRYKQRMLMTIFGVAGSLALLFSGLGILSSLNGMIERQYGSIIQYDALVAQYSNIRQEKIDAIQLQLQNHQIKNYTSLLSKTYIKKIEGIATPQTITLLATNSSFEGYINLFDAHHKQSLTLIDNSVYITEKIATQLNVKTGDTITLEDKYTLKITGIVELYAGHFIFMNAKTYEQIFNEPWQQNAYLLNFKDTSHEIIEQTTAQFMALDGVKTVVQNTTMQKTIVTLVKSLTTVMLVLTVVSILLGIVILYNLTTINIAERIRELSTIKVLGFFNKEITRYIYRETIILSIIGMIFGLIFGRLLHRLIIDTVATPVMMFNPNVNLWVYIVPCVIIGSVVIILGVIVHKKLEKIDMLEALKSVE